MLSGAVVQGKSSELRYPLGLGTRCLLSAMPWEVVSVFKSRLGYAQKGIALRWQGKGSDDFKNTFFFFFLSAVFEVPWDPQDIKLC